MYEYIAGRYVGTWTYVDCMPVTDTYIGGQTGFVHWRYLQCMYIFRVSTTFSGVARGVSKGARAPPSCFMKQ